MGKNRITVYELLIHLVLARALMIGGYYLTRWAGLQVVEVWSGQVVSKPSGSSSCCHSYRCRCRVVTNDPRPAEEGALRAAWLGGKNNDVVIVAGTPAFPAIA